MATEVMFPDSSMHLVEGIYCGNQIADFYNQLVAFSLVSFIQKRLPTLQSTEKIKILEVGAGTGGTSTVLFDAIRDYAGKITYVYTDISLKFTNYGKEKYGSQHHFLEYKLLDIEKDVLAQGFKPGEYDVIIGTNVIHATRKIPKSLMGIKVLLKKNGWLIVNEITRRFNVLTLTFGLLDGWWLFEDAENRIPGCPLLNPSQWHTVLKDEGFDTVEFLGQDGDNSEVIGQRVIVAESNGEIRNQDRLPAGVPKEFMQQTPPRTYAISFTDENPAYDRIAGDEIREYIKTRIIDNLIQTLGVTYSDIQMEQPFTAYGVDSLIGVDVVKKISKDFNIPLSTSVLFDYPNIRLLTGFIDKEYGAQIFSQNSPSGNVPYKNLPAHDSSQPRGLLSGYPEYSSYIAAAKSSSDIAIIGITGIPGILQRVPALFQENPLLGVGLFRFFAGYIEK